MTHQSDVEPIRRYILGRLQEAKSLAEIGSLESSKFLLKHISACTHLSPLNNGSLHALNFAMFWNVRSFVDECSRNWICANEIFSRSRHFVRTKNEVEALDEYFKAFQSRWQEATNVSIDILLTNNDTDIEREIKEEFSEGVQQIEKIGSYSCYYRNHETVIKNEQPQIEFSASPSSFLRSSPSSGSVNKNETLSSLRLIPNSPETTVKRQLAPSTIEKYLGIANCDSENSLSSDEEEVEEQKEEPKREAVVISRANTEFLDKIEGKENYSNQKRPLSSLTPKNDLDQINRYDCNQRSQLKSGAIRISGHTAPSSSSSYQQQQQEEQNKQNVKKTIKKQKTIVCFEQEEAKNILKSHQKSLSPTKTVVRSHLLTSPRSKLKGPPMRIPK